MNEVLRAHGTITRDGGHVIIRRVGDTLAGQQPGVECENPSSPEEDRIYRKVFTQKRIYFPEDYERAVSDNLSGKDSIVLGMTGYSNLSSDNCRDWGIEIGAYEAACQDLLGHQVQVLQAEFPGTQVHFAHGASPLGVDRAVLEVARELNIRHLGFSCPEYMFYVPDDLDPVYVADTRSSYSESFVLGLDILLSVGGRIQALEHDMLAAIRYNKRLVLLNVLRAISTTGGPPARDRNGNIIDATAAFEQAIYLPARPTEGADNLYEELREYAAHVVRHTSRKILGPERAYSRWRRGL